MQNKPLLAWIIACFPLSRKRATAFATWVHDTQWASRTLLDGNWVAFTNSCFFLKLARYERLRYLRFPFFLARIWANSATRTSPRLSRSRESVTPSTKGSSYHFLHKSPVSAWDRSIRYVGTFCRASSVWQFVMSDSRIVRRASRDFGLDDLSSSSPFSWWPVPFSPFGWTNVWRDSGK